MKDIVFQKHLLKPIVVLIVFCATLLLMGVMFMTAFGLDEVKTGAVDVQATSENNAALQSDTDVEDTAVPQEGGVEVYPTAEDLYFERDQEYMAKTFPKYDPTAKDKFIPVEFTFGGEGYYKNSLLFLTSPGLDDMVINDIFADIDTVKIASVVGNKAKGLIVELLLEDESQEDSITLRLLDDGRIVIGVGKRTFSVLPEHPDEIQLPVEYYYDLYFNRDQDYMTKIFPKYDPTARDKFISVVHTSGGGGYFRNSLVFLTIPGLEDTVINDILADIDTVKIADVNGGKSRGLTVELLLEDESQEKSITERLLADSRVAEAGEKSGFFASDDTSSVSDVSTQGPTTVQNPTTAQNPTTTLPRTGDGNLGFLGIIAVLILSSGSLFTAAYRSLRRSY
jgi:hypothetical protein